jgi:hypothetical protein
VRLQTAVNNSVDRRLQRRLTDAAGGGRFSNQDRTTRIAHRTQ